MNSILDKPNSPESPFMYEMRKINKDDGQIVYTQLVFTKIEDWEKYFNIKKI